MARRPPVILYDPDEQDPITVDWAGPVEDDGPWLNDGETLVSSEWEVNEPLEVVQEGFDDTKASITVTGGVEGEQYVITNTVVTTQPRTKDQRLTLRARND